MKRRGFLAGIGGAIGAASLSELFAHVAESTSAPVKPGAQPAPALHGVTCTINGHPFHVVSIQGPSNYAELDAASLNDAHPVYHSGDYGDVEVRCYPDAKVMDICRQSFKELRRVELAFHLGDDETTIHCMAVISKYEIDADPHEPLAADITFRMVGSSVVLS